MPVKPAPAAVTPPPVKPAPAAVAPPPVKPTPGVTTPPPGAPVPAVTAPPPGVPIPGVVPPPAAGAPAGKPATLAPAHPVVVPLGETKIVEDIIEPKLSGNALAGLYRKYTGRRVIVSAAASIAEFSFVQDASVQDPLTYAKAAELLKKAATIENFVFVPDDQDTNLDILTLSTGGIRPTGRGVDVYNENSPLPEGDAVISYVMTLSYIKPAEAVNTFTQIIGQIGSYGSIAAVPNAAAVVITENTSLIRKLIDLKKEIDKPSSQVATRFIKVTYADVTEIAATLTELLTAQQSTQKTAGIQRAEAAATAPVAAPAGAPTGGPNAGQPGGASSGEENPVQIIPEPRTNRIFAMGRPVDLLFVEGLVHEFDVPTSDKTFLRRKLRFLTVSDFLPIASDALTRAFSGGGEAGGAAGAAGGTGKPAARTPAKSGQASSGSSGQGSRGGSSSSGFGGNSSGFSGSSGGSSGSRGGGSSGSSGGRSGSGLGESNVSSAPESLLVGRTLLVADNITNSVVVQGPPSGLEIIERLLDQLDVKPDQIMISTVIGQLTLDNNKTFGMDYFGVGGDLVAHGGGDGLSKLLAAIFAARNGTILTPTDPTPILSGSGLHMYGKIGNNLNFYLEALQSKTDFTVLSRPSIFTSNNQKGTISSGERIAIPTSSNSFTNGGASTNIEYQDVVLKLEVIPLVNSEKEITMQIALLNDEQNGTQDIQGAGANGGLLTVPKISTREILTTATVPNNETIVLGGLVVGKNNESKSGIPILSDIPYLGRLFSHTNNDKSRSELMIFIQPSIVSSSSTLGDVQSSMDSRYKVSSDVRNFAEGGGVLPGDKDNTQVESTGKNGSSSKAVVYPSAPATTMKPSIRPTNLH